MTIRPITIALFSIGVVPAGAVDHLPDIPCGRLAIELETLVVDRGIEQPLQVTHAGDGSNRLFIVEKYR